MHLLKRIAPCAFSNRLDASLDGVALFNSMGTNEMALYNLNEIVYAFVLHIRRLIQ